MSTEPAVPDVDATAEDAERRRRLLEESMASSGRISLREPARDPEANPRSGGDPSKAPVSFHATELHPIEMASSGASWDDPEEL